MILADWLSDLPTIANSGEADGIAQKAISYHFIWESLDVEE
jgi:hypothetical protein